MATEKHFKYVVLGGGVSGVRTCARAFDSEFLEFPDL
jgi:hypothetical protein